MAIESITERSADGLTDAQWDIAHAIAQSLVKDGTDVNELGKAIAYLRSILNESDAGDRFFKYLKTLVIHGRQVSHSGRTLDYYRSIEKACSPLKQESLDARIILHILSWASRLVRYYKISPIAEWSERDLSSKVIPSVTESERQIAIEKLKKNQTFREGQIIEVRVEKKHSKGNKVTYLIASVPFTEKESKTFSLIPDGGMVKVQIKSLKEDGSINHVKFIQI